MSPDLCAPVAIAPDGKTAYVANYSSNNVTPIDTTTLVAGKSIALPHVARGPVAIAVS